MERTRTHPGEFAECIAALLPAYPESLEAQAALQRIARVLNAVENFLTK